MRSCDTYNLQFESDYNEALRTYLVKKGTERLVCPVCHHEHKEEDKAWMIQNGGYVHKIPELVKERPRISDWSTSFSASSIVLVRDCQCSA